MKLKAKFLVPSLAVIVAGMTIATTVSYVSSADALQSTIRNQLEQISYSLAHQMEIWVGDLEAGVVDNAKREDFSALLVTSAELNSSQNNGGIAKETPPGNPSGFVQKSVQICQDIFEDYGYFDFVGLTNRDGLVLAAHDAAHVGKMSLAERDYFKKAMQGNVVVSEPVVSKATGKPIFVVAAPVKQNGQVLGVFVNAVKLSHFNENFVDQIKIGEQGYAYMFNKQGMILAHPVKSNILELDISGLDFGKTMLQKKNGFEEYIWKGADKLVAFSEVPQTGWIVAAGADLQDIYAPIYKVRRDNIIVAVLMVFIVGLVIFFIVRSIVTAVFKAVAFSQNIRQGDVSQRLQLEREDEIGDLGNALNEMADGLQQKAQVAQEIADGDLTCMVNVASDKDSLGLALEKMVQNLRAIIGSIQEASSQINSGSSQVSDASQSLSQGATESAASLEEISSSVTQVESQTRQNAENAGHANQLADSAKSSAGKGSESMDQMMTAMSSINESSQEIGKIIKVIDEIAFQTNLLALNAAVEAARAGQHGKGFAVVAEEVRNLAARSAKAAKETAGLIEDSIHKVTNGNSVAQSTAAALTEIVESISKVTDIVGEISSASHEQAEGMGQISQALAQIDSVTQQNAANAEETASASEELSSQAMQLQHSISRFKVDGQSRTGSHRLVHALDDTDSYDYDQPAKLSHKTTRPGLEYNPERIDL